MSTIVSVTSDEALAAIEGTLRTEIIDVFRSCLDRLTALDRGAAYEAVMNEPEILHQAFDLFRRQLELFSAFLGDERGQNAPARDDQLLRCGDTLYRAIRTYLRFDWQARLLPAYSRFTPELIGELGARLLEIREPAELTALTEEAGQRYLESHGWGLAVQE